MSKTDKNYNRLELFLEAGWSDVGKVKVTFIHNQGLHSPRGNLGRVPITFAADRLPFFNLCKMDEGGGERTRPIEPGGDEIIAKLTWKLTHFADESPSVENQWWNHDLPLIPISVRFVSRFPEKRPDIINNKIC